MNQLNIIPEIAIWGVPILFAITVHEVAHGWVANQLGDRTALWLGRLTLNPFKHVDITGTIIVPALCFLLGNFIFGWAKPVPVEWRNLKNPKRDMALVALAGPLANFLMAFIWAFLAKIATILSYRGYPQALLLVYMGQAGIVMNVTFMVLNLLPIPPLDGARVVASLLPARLEQVYSSIEPYGTLILLGLILSKVLTQILTPAVEGIQQFITLVFAL